MNYELKESFLNKPIIFERNDLFRLARQLTNGKMRRIYIYLKKLKTK